MKVSWKYFVALSNLRNVEFWNIRGYLKMKHASFHNKNNAVWEHVFFSKHHYSIHQLSVIKIEIPLCHNKWKKILLCNIEILNYKYLPQNVHRGRLICFIYLKYINLCYILHNTYVVHVTHIIYICYICHIYV